MIPKTIDIPEHAHQSKGNWLSKPAKLYKYLKMTLQTIKKYKVHRVFKQWMLSAEAMPWSIFPQWVENVELKWILNLRDINSSGSTPFPMDRSPLTYQKIFNAEWTVIVKNKQNGKSLKFFHRKVN